jgi:hypothetical protein
MFKINGAQMATSAFKSSVYPTKIRKSVAAAVPASAKSEAAVIEVKGILAYPSLATPDPKSGDKYSTLLLVTDPEDQQALIDLVQVTTEQTFRSEELPAGAHNPLRESNEKNHAGEFAFKHPAFRVADGMVIRAKTSYMPRCVAGEAEVEVDPSEIAGGDLVVVQISAYGYSNQSQGVALSLGRVWLIEKGQNKIERGSSAGAGNVKRIDRSRLRFSSEVESGAA